MLIFPQRPFPFLLASQLWDPAIVVPTYLALSVLMPTFWFTIGREVPFNTWRDLPAALVMGFVLPTTLTIIKPVARPLCLLSPVLVPTFLFGIRFWNKRSAGFERVTSGQVEGVKGAVNVWNRAAARPDVVYGLVVTFLAAAHLSILSAVSTACPGPQTPWFPTRSWPFLPRRSLSTRSTTCSSCAGGATYQLRS